MSLSERFYPYAMVTVYIMIVVVAVLDLFFWRA